MPVASWLRLASFFFLPWNGTSTGADLVGWSRCVVVGNSHEVGDAACSIAICRGPAPRRAAGPCTSHTNWHVSPSRRVWTSGNTPPGAGVRIDNRTRIGHTKCQCRSCEVMPRWGSTRGTASRASSFSLITFHGFSSAHVYCSYSIEPVTLYVSPIAGIGLLSTITMHSSRLSRPVLGLPRLVWLFRPYSSSSSSPTTTYEYLQVSEPRPGVGQGEQPRPR
jgi:hypothetical protein